MTALEALRQYGPLEASVIAEIIGQAHEALYADLVAAEGSGAARVVVHHAGGQRWCEWEAI